MKKINDVFLKGIEYYQTNKPEYKKGRCKHIPSCSNYAKECYEKFHFIKASFLTLTRILRCTPWRKPSFDPVPRDKEEQKELSKRIDFCVKLKEDLKKIYKCESNFQDLMERVFQEDNIVLGTEVFKAMIKQKEINVPKRYIKLVDQSLAKHVESLTKESV